MTVIENLAKTAQPFLDIPFVRRTRRNHGLEHATVHVLSGRVANLSVAGRSDTNGFWLLGDLETAQVEQATRDALRRMKNGEHHLALHPNCGTSLLATGSMIGVAALLSTVGIRRGALEYFARVPTMITLAMLAIITSRPVGMQLQQHFTTLGDPGNLEITGIKRTETRGPRGGKVVLHRISTTSA